MPEKFEMMASQALGRSWKKMLAKEIGCTKRTIIRAVKSRKGVPAEVQGAFSGLVAQKKSQG